MPRSLSSSRPGWPAALRARLPRLGHRNWIGVVDAAYPLQTAPGIELLVAPQPLLSVLARVLRALTRAPHVRPRAFLDAELAHVREPDAPGIEDVRRQLAAALSAIPTSTLLHEQLLARLDAAGRRYHVLLIKSSELRPYSSVFLELDCKYWSEAAERGMRRALAARPRVFSK